MPRGGGTQGEDVRRGLLVDHQHIAQFDAGLVNQYGIHANAEDMILAHQRSFTPALRRANLSQVDGEATAELKKKTDWEKSVAKKLGLGDTDRVLDAAVRGNALVAVVENELGYTRKEVGAANDSYEGPALTPDEEVQHAEAQRDRTLAEQTRALRAEAELKLAEARSEIDAYMAEQLQKLRAEADKTVEKAQADAAKAADKPASKPRKSPATRKSPSQRSTRTVKGGSGTTTGSGLATGGAPTPTGEGEGEKT